MKDINKKKKDLLDCIYHGSTTLLPPLLWFGYIIQELIFLILCKTKLYLGAKEGDKLLKFCSVTSLALIWQHIHVFQELIPLILCTAMLHPDAKERDNLLNILFNLIKKPDEEQR